MAATLTIEIDLSDKTIAQAAREVSAKVRDAFRNAGDGLNSGLDAARNKLQAIGSQLEKLGPALTQAGTTLTAAITLPLGALATVATKAAVENDKYEKTLTAITGSAERARAKIAELRDVAQKSPGVLTASAVATYAQLKAIGDVTEGTINKVIKATGKLSSVFDVGDAKEFNRNLTQIFQQGFERSDIKEAIGRVPIFEQLLESAFGTKDADKLRQLKEAGKITMDSFFAGMADAANNDPRLRNIQESIGSQFEKLKDRVLTALIPLGEVIIRAVSPVVTALVPVIEKLAAAFAGLPQPVQTAIVLLGGIVAAAGPVLLILGNLATGIASIIGLFGAGGALAGAGAAIGSLATPLGIVAASVAALWVAWQTNFGNIRGLTNDVVAFVIERWDALVAWYQRNIPLIREAVAPVLEAVGKLFEFWSNNVKAIIFPLWESVKTATREAFTVLGDLVTAGLYLITGRWSEFGEQLQKLNVDLFNAIRNIFAQSIVSLIDAVKGLFDSIGQLTGVANSTGTLLGDALGGGIMAALRVQFPIIADFVEAFLRQIRGDVARTQAEIQRAAERRNFDQYKDADKDINVLGYNPANVITPTVNAPASASKPNVPKAAASTAGGNRGESQALREAKAERAAIIDLAKQRQAEEIALARQAASEREAQLQQEFNFQRISYEQFYADKLQLQQAAIQRELDANALAIERANREVIEASSNAKTKLSEVIRLSTQLGKLRNEQKLLEGKRDNLAPASDREQEIATKRLEQSLEQLRLRYAEVTGAKQQAFDMSLTLQFEKALEEAASAPEFLRTQFEKLIPAIKQALILQNQFDTRTRESQLRSEIEQSKLSAAEAEIQGLRNQGLLTETQATEQLIFLRRQQRESLLAELEVRRQIIVESAAAFPQRQLESQKELAAIDAQIASVRTLGTELTRTEQIQLQMAKQGVLDYQELNNSVQEFLAAQKGVTQIFADFQTNQIKTAFDFLDAGIDRITKGLGKTGNAVRELIKDLVRLAATKILQALFNGQTGGTLGGKRVAGQASGGLGGILGAILGGNRAATTAPSFGGFGGGTFGGSIFSGGATGGSNAGGLGGIIRNILGGNGPSLSVPASITSSAGTLPLGIGLGSQRTVELTNIVSGIGGKGLSGILGGLFKGIGFGQQAGSGGALAGVLPLLGLSLGSSLGGQSGPGQILGAAGGGLLGIGLTAAPAALAGATGGLSGAVAGLFSNPITAVVGGALLVGSFLLGKAKQRKADEAQVDTYWVEYMNVLKELTTRVNSDRISGDDALTQAAEARSTAVALISQIKTKSVRESRLANQIPDVDRLFLKPLQDAVERQRKRGGRINNLIPEFATGGVVPGIDRGKDDVLALLKPQEVVLNRVQQTRIKAIAGEDVFARAQVPGFNSPRPAATLHGLPAYATGGRVNVIERFTAQATRTEHLVIDINYALTTTESGDIVEAGLSTERGRGVTVRTRRRNRLNREET